MASEDSNQIYCNSEGEKMIPKKHSERMAASNCYEGLEFNKQFPDDRSNNLSLSERLEKFQRKKHHVQHDDFSGLPASSLLENLLRR